MDINFKSTWPGYSGQTFPNYNGGPYEGFQMPQQAFYGSHRSSDPGLFARNRQVQDDGIDLSHFDAVAQNTVHNLQVQDVIKPEQASPWVGAQQEPHQYRRFPQLNSTTEYARTEPPLPLSKQDIFSETADSGYQTQLPTTSTFTESNLIWNNQQAEQAPSRRVPQDSRSTVSDGRIIRGSGDVRNKPPLRPCRWPRCGRVPKNQSDAKKHELTHTKPFRCTEQDCGRKDGFATINDLQRHRKSVHNLQPTVGNPAGFICVACNVPDGGHPKFWPRRDNFKAHIKRKHPSFNEDAVIERSKQLTRPDDARTVDDDARTVRSALQSAAHHSQTDPDESHGYKQLSSSPSLSRHPSEQGHYPSNLWPSSNAPIFSSDEMLAGMQGHNPDLQYPPAVAHADMNGLNYMSEPADPFAMPDSSPFSQEPSSKRPRLSSHAEFCTFGRMQNEHSLNVTEAQTSSGSSGVQSDLSPPQTMGEFHCQECPKITKRECDLKKHMKRHTRPYGCTFPNCQKKFGSRNDWKRHETTQHFLQEMWKCQCKRFDGSDCARRPVYHLEQMKKHLRGQEHLMRDETAIVSLCREFRLGRDGHDHFWCGFCNRLISQSRDVQNASDERFKHIGDHFDKDNKDSGDWVCIIENKAKRFITPEERKEARRRARNGFRDDDDEIELSDYLGSHAFGTELPAMFPAQKQSFHSSADRQSNFDA